jgi:hypothetical protein
LAAVFVLIVLAHAFAACVFLGFILLLALLAPFAVARLVRLGAALVPGGLILARWFALGRGEHAGGPGLLSEIIHGHPSLAASAALFYDWTRGGLGNHVNDVALLGMAASVVGCAAFAGFSRIARRSIAPGGLRAVLWRARYVVLLAAALVLFYRLPMTIHAPYWWAVSVRLVPIAWLLLILAIPAPTRRWPTWLFLPAVAAALFYHAYLAYDFRTWFAGVEMAGLDAALDEIPPGRRVQGLWPDFTSERHYAHYPIAHAVNYYVVRRGGIANPMMDGHGLKDLWIVPRPRPPSPPWGLARAFSWRAHGGGWDYFLVKAPPPGAPPMVPLFRDAPPGAVRLVARHDLWSVYERMHR